ncbi:MAG TPA: hypothetical protein DD381_01315 [Lentisphaeria bacterium]|nr:MAG: hypothetical protein A2X47_10715 [Lentisphaerae bacterium GWF2_38_69]HBM14983.1 hypothetical protein [Lentisphaeria bacterium]
MFKKFYRTLSQDIWQYSETEGKKIKTLFIRIYKIIALTIRGFRENNCYLKASALTFYTVFSVVPVAALAFAIAKGFGLEDKLRLELMDILKNQQQVLDKILTFSENLLSRTAGGLIAGIGVILLLWTIIKLFSNIENAFNEIWRVKQGRIFLRKVTDYLSMFFICPILLVVSASFTAFLSSDMRVNNYLPKYIIILFPTIFSHLAIWILLTFVYRIMPYSKMKLTSAIIPAIIVGTIFNIIQFTYFDLQLFITKYNGIYGTFAALPLFLLWVQANWIIVLAGAQLSFYIDTIELHEFDYSIKNISFRQRKILALMTMKAIVDNFKVKDTAMNAKELSTKLQLPYNLTGEILNSLVSAKIISPVSTNSNTSQGYQPSKCITTISVRYVISKLELLNYKETLNFPYAQSEKFDSLLKKLEALQENSELNLLIKDI